MSTDGVVEKVPKFVRRIGDAVYEGSNNTLIVLGTDRPGNSASGLGHPKSSGAGRGTGTIHLVAGRKNADPDFAKDSAFVYLTQKSKVDKNLGLSGIEQSDDDVAAGIMKSDHIRIVGRKNIKIAANDDEKHYLFMDGKKVTVKWGDNTIEMDEDKAVITVAGTKLTLDGIMVKIDSPKINLVGGCGAPLEKLLDTLTQAHSLHTHMTAVGPATPPSLGVGPGDSPNSPALAAVYASWKTAWNPS